jgi:hypothetical protein
VAIDAFDLINDIRRAQRQLDQHEKSADEQRAAVTDFSDQLIAAIKASGIEAVEHGDELWYIDKGELKTRPANRIINSMSLKLPRTSPMPLAIEVAPPTSQDSQSRMGGELSASAFEATLPAPTFSGLMSGDDMLHTEPEAPLSRIDGPDTTSPASDLMAEKQESRELAGVLGGVAFSDDDSDNGFFGEPGND